jgi:hypothetical protein
MDQQLNQKPIKAKLSLKVHAMCGWPLILIVMGGAIGGGLGGLAYGINIAIYKSKLTNPVKILLNIFVGLSAFIVWFIIATQLLGLIKK